MIRKNVAYHEAGHAVASLLIGEGIHAIKIARPSDKGLITDRRGRTVRATGLAELSGSMSPVILRLTLEDRPVMRALMIAVTFNQVFVNGAGIAAEGRASKRNAGMYLDAFVPPVPGGSGGGDAKHSISLVEALGYGRKEASRLASETWSATQCLIRRGSAWRATTAIAEAVLDGVEDGDELEGLGRAILTEAPDSPLRTPIFLPDGIRGEFPHFDDELAALLAALDSLFDETVAAARVP
jgi:hypothetical protein